MDEFLKPKTGKGNEQGHASFPVSFLVPLSSFNTLPFQVSSIFIAKLGGK